MSWRTVVVTGIAKLDYKMDYLVVRKKNETNRVHLSEIGVLIIESTMVSLTTTLIVELNKNKIKVIFCDEKHNPTSEIVSFYGSHDASGKLKEQIMWSDEIKGIVATAIIKDKISKQRSFLVDLDLIDEADLLERYINEIKARDESNREGHAAKVYFNAVFGKGFARSKDCALNSCLNFGYGLLLSMFNREIVSSGYSTKLGIFHTNQFNYFNFSSDLMEPFRVLIDRQVYEMEPQKFEKNEKRMILDVLNSQVRIGGKNRYINGAIKSYCKSVFNALNSEDARKILFYEK